MTSDSKDSHDSPFGIPGAGNLHEVMASMQKAWGFNSSTPMTPTIDIEEIDRRLQDLNTISQWLSLNQNMLQSTIQTLQVQRATLAAIQSFGAAAENKGDSDAVSPLDVMQAFTKMFAPAGEPESAGPAESTGQTQSGQTDKAPGMAGGTGMAADPQQWWAMLQNQFAQVANVALSTQKAAAKAAASSSRKASAKTTKSKAARKPVKPKSM